MLHAPTMTQKNPASRWLKPCSWTSAVTMKVMYTTYVHPKRK
jgi:hypothetical protein